METAASSPTAAALASSPRARVLASTGAAAIAFAVVGPSGRGVVAGGFAAVLVVLAAIDLERRLLPNRIVLPATGAVLVAQTLVAPEHALACVIAAAGTYLALLAVAIATRGGIGMGDVKMGLLLGAGLGGSVVFALVLASFAGGLYSVYLLSAHGAAARKTAIAYGPFLALGAFVATLAS